MSKAIPDIISVETSDDCCTLNLKMSADLAVFEGHFPEVSVLPGVAQLDWAVAFAKQELGYDSSRVVLRVEVLKFQHLIMPGKIVALTLTRKSDDKFTFSYSCDESKYASGRIVFKDAS